MKNDCPNLYVLSTIACQLAECLDEKELKMLAADLNALGYMIESLLARRPASTKNKASQCGSNESW